MRSAELDLHQVGRSREAFEKFWAIKFTVFKSVLNENELGSSDRMEKEGLIRSLEFLDRTGVKVANLSIYHLSVCWLIV